MFRKIKMHIILVLSVCLLVFSCLEDEGNYEYTEVNEITFEGIEELYVIERFSKFEIKPQLTYTKDSNNYTYKWYTTPSEGYETEVFSEEKDLSLEKIGWGLGVHDVYYLIKDENTGVEYQYRFKVEIDNPIKEGWLVLSEVNGGSRLDMLTYKSQLEEFQFIEDVLDFTNSELELEGTPESLIMIPWWNRGVAGIYITTSGNGTRRLSPKTFEFSYSFEREFVSIQPDKLKADNIAFPRPPGYGFAMTNGNVYNYYRGAAFLDYNEPINKIDGVHFEASPFLAPGFFIGSSIGYDNTNRRFVKYSQAFRNPHAFEISSGFSTLFDYNDTGKDLIYMLQVNYNLFSAFAFLKDPVDSKYYLAVFSPMNTRQSHYGEIIAPDFDKAISYAVSPVFGTIFYAVGGKVYLYNFNTGSTKLMLDRPEEVTLLKFNDYSDFRSPKGHKLIVCTHDGSQDGGGVVEIYTVPPVNGQITLDESYSGFGKIKGISYKE